MRDTSRSKSASSQNQQGHKGKHKRDRHDPKLSRTSRFDSNQPYSSEASGAQSQGTNMSPMRDSMSKLSFPPSVYQVDQSAMDNSYMNQTSLTTGDVAETFRAQVLAACQVTTTISPSVTTAFVPESKSQTLTPLIEAFSLERFQIPDLSGRPTPPAEPLVNLNGDIAEAFRAQVLAACAAKEASAASMDDLVSAISSDPVTGAITANESPNMVPSVFKTPTMDPVIVENLPQDPPIPMTADVSFADPVPETMTTDEPLESIITPPIVPAPLECLSTGPRVSVAKLMPVITPVSPKSPQSEEFEVHEEETCNEDPPVTAPTTVMQEEKENSLSPKLDPDTPKIVSQPPAMVNCEEMEREPEMKVVQHRNSIAETFDFPMEGTLCPRNSVVDAPVEWTDFPSEGTLCPRNSVVEPPAESPRKAIYEGILLSPKKIVGGGAIVMDMMGMLSPKAKSLEESDEPIMSLFSSAKKEVSAPAVSIMDDDLVTSFVSVDMGAAIAAPLSPPKIFSSDPITEKVLDEIIETIMQEQAVVSQPLPTGDEENPVGMIVKLTPEAPVETAPQTSFYVDLVRDNGTGTKSFSSEIPISPIESLKVNNVPPEREMNWLPTAGPPMPGMTPIIQPTTLPSPPSPPSPPKQKKKCFCF